MKRIDFMKDLIERKGADAELPSIYAELFTLGELLDLCEAQETARKLLPDNTEPRTHKTWGSAMEQRDRDFNRRYYNNPDGKPKFR